MINNNYTNNTIIWQDFENKQSLYKIRLLKIRTYWINVELWHAHRYFKKIRFYVYYDLWKKETEE